MPIKPHDTAMADGLASAQLDRDAPQEPIEETDAMGVSKRLEDWLVRRRYARAARYLSTVGPSELMADGERRVLKAFHRAARHVPAYRRILARHAVDPQRINTLDEFRRHVPIVDKQSVFAENDLRDLCVGGNLDGVSLFFSSSGHSGTFSFGVETWDDVRRTARELEFVLHNAFGILDRRTLYVNCNAMGVSVHTRTLPLAQTSVRPDVIWALVSKLKDDFDQFLINGEHPFVKKVIDEGPDHGIEWEDLVVHVITGGEYIAESFRTYLASRLGVDFDRPERGMIGVTFGVSELAVSLFQESLQTIRLRRLAQTDRNLRLALCGRETSICPSIMQYFPHQAFVETVAGPDGTSQLVVTTLGPRRKLPLVRYNTRDAVETMAYDDFAAIVRDFGHESLLPPFRLPVAIVWGRSEPLRTQEGADIYPEQVKEALYADLAVAEAVTSRFRLLDGGGGVRLLVQLREGRPVDARIGPALQKHLERFGLTEVAIELLPYEAFPYGFAQDFETKNRYT